MPAPAHADDGDDASATDPDASATPKRRTSRRALGSCQVLKAGALYFGLVFAAGFVLGPIRELWAVPRVGVRTAELLEMPLMLAAIVLAARWIIRRLVMPATRARRLGAGLVALGLLLIAELTGGLALRGQSLGDYIATRDPASGTAYVAMLCVFTVMPVLVARR